MHIHNVSKKYLNEKGITNIKHTSRYWGFFTNKTIKNLINDGYPVILFGNLEDPPGYTGKRAVMRLLPINIPETNLCVIMVGMIVQK